MSTSSGQIAEACERSTTAQSGENITASCSFSLKVSTDARATSCEDQTPSFYKDAKSCDNQVLICDNQAKSCDKQTANEANKNTCDHVIEEEPIKFDPPLYKQRYCAVADLLRNHGVTSVVEFGIAEANVLLYYKGIQSLRRIVGVDIDEELLTRVQWKALPLTTDYIQPRKNKLSIELLCGSVAEYDTRTSECDAVTMIEVVEHLEEDVLTRMVPNLFGNLRPALVVMTTPNAEYNVLFPGFSGFRHPDHKFEWTRKQFQDWCEAVAEKYKYTVTYSGVGEPPPSSQEVGHCSQIAVFQRTQGDHCSNENGDLSDDDNNYLSSHCVYNQYSDPHSNQCDDHSNQHDDHSNQLADHSDGLDEMLSAGESAKECMPYKLITKQEHPHQDLGLSEDQQILNEAFYYINWMGIDYKHALKHGDIQCDHWSEENQLEIALEQLMVFRKLADLCPDKDRLRTILVDAGVTFSTEHEDVIIHTIDVTDDDDTEDDNDIKDDDAHSSCEEWNDSLPANQNAGDNDEWDEDNNETQSMVNVSSPNKEESWDEIETPVPVNCVYVGSPGSNPQPQIPEFLNGIEPSQFSDAEDDSSVPELRKSHCDVDDLTEKTSHMTLQMNQYSETHLPPDKIDTCVPFAAHLDRNHASQTHCQLSEDHPSDDKCLGQGNDSSALNANLPQQDRSLSPLNISQGSIETTRGTYQHGSVINHVDTRDISSNHVTDVTPVENRETPPSHIPNIVESRITLNYTANPTDTQLSLDRKANLARLESHVVRCLGCGCEMTQLGNCGPALCGLTLRCRTSFTERFRTAVELRTSASIYRATVAGQFSDPY